jgi:hypothetical protein
VFEILELAEKRNLKMIVNLVLVRLAEIMIRLNYPQEATAILNRIISYIISYAELYEQCKTQYLMALAYSLSNNCRVYTSEIQNCLLDAISGLNL